MVMQKIKFGTDGWRAIIADDFTLENLRRVSEGTALWMRKNKMNLVVIGHDTRYGGKLFSESAASIFGAFGIKVILSPDYVSTPMVSLGVFKTSANLGVVITASHNPPTYNGFKLKSHLGGPLTQGKVDEVEALIPEKISCQPMSLDDMKSNGLLEYIDLEAMYLEHIEANFDLKTIKSSGIKVAYDAMYGAGQRVFLKILPDVIALHCENNPSFYGRAPEPIERNLGEISRLIATEKNIQLGIANDGDADRIGLFDENGKFVDSHRILLLLLLYLYQYKKMTGKIIFTFSVTDKLKKMADYFGLPSEITKIGFKYIADIMSCEDVLVGGEESGGLAVKGHIPERDGIWIGLMVLEFMATTGKSISELVQEVYDIVGPFAFDRHDLHLSESKKQAIIKACEQNIYTEFGEFSILNAQAFDGYKFTLGEDTWVMIRPSGTEPVLRVYAQAKDEEMVKKILTQVINHIQKD
jgi:phosphomannomutase